ncbi:hypothetical protein CXH12_10855 [Citrobacter portucalensis]|uniref:DUF3850 domain-containing protein n=1 Tax=Citrobacter TaxID=544 RepID=UPI000C9FAF93|nr:MULTISPECIES: DUF3850 domain-containing protein [Citrobacter]EAN6475176.1 DUF3850 domain-containing protein [Salmonella enterica]EDQ8010209.1 DUF3850 domain-containing protein [Salmonella enterica subsp. enterica serovar Java]EGE5593101.1 DUF3850 domain-containing protein [Salmonella enterica subsp. enterica serovar Adelaide]EAP8324537.1 DUF3850 domain-containing protein [Salmonella enterica]EAW6835129.1 DUF3850 domain-containing protein [Salmonella enterica]
MGTVHELKIGPMFFSEVLSGNKKAEFRINDREFKCGDFLMLREWEGEYTGNQFIVRITHILEVSKLVSDCSNWVMLSIEPINDQSASVKG